MTASHPSSSWLARQAHLLEMQPVDPLDLIGAQPAAAHLSTADYVRLLHPPGPRGKGSLMAIYDGENT